MEHEGGSVPFVCELTQSYTELQFHPGKNRLTIAINGTLTPETVPQGEAQVEPTAWASTGYRRLYQNGIVRDYWEYAGLVDSVFLYTTPATFIQDINVTTGYHYDDGGVLVGLVNYTVRGVHEDALERYRDTTGNCRFNVELLNKNGQTVARNEGASGVLIV